VVDVNGLVNSVQRVARGSELTVAAVVGATVLSVDSTEDFDDAGGDLEINGVRYSYESSNLDLDTITLSTPGLTAAVDEGDGVYLVLGGQIAIDHIAFVSLGEGDEAEVIIPFSSRNLWPEGDLDEPVPVTLTPDLESIATVPGRSPVMDIGDVFRVDSSSGEVTIIGEIGTAPPGEIGVFLFSTKFSHAGAQAAMPTVQFNTGATVVQPRIEGSTVAAAGLFLSSGRDTGERESKLNLDNNSALLLVQDVPGGTTGSYLWVENDRITARVNTGGTTGAALGIGDDVDIRSRARYGAANLAGQFKSYEAGDEAYAFVGLQNLAGTNKQGFTVRANASTRVSSAGPLEVTTAGGTTWRPVQAASFDVMSDRRSKRKLAAPKISALDALRAAPTYEYAYRDDPDGVLRLGVMADDLPDILTVELGVDDPDHFAAGMKGVSLPQWIALISQAVLELDVDVDGLRAQKPIRAERKTTS
jgi:hypothetical protein